MLIQIRPQPYDAWQELSTYEQQSTLLKPGRYGACASFIGTMRDFNEGDDVGSMVLEHYEGMTEKQLTDVVKESMQTHDLLDALVLHRVGEVWPNDPIVLVAAWSAHRKQAFDACREMMEHLKSRATFWKKESLADGERWVKRNTAG